MIRMLPLRQAFYGRLKYRLLSTYEIIEYYEGGKQSAQKR